ncbi:DUF2789 family protein [Colwelliaceae bacterium BS250]
MDLSRHDIAGLFAQLGLNNDSEGIKEFIAAHKGLKQEIKLQDATMWTKSQANFLSDALALDSDWSEVVDVLDSMLR